MTDDEKQTAVRDRNADFDGRFVYAVTTTGVYCRPSCPSRQENPENMVFFDAAGQAEGAGFRACLRCRPDMRSLKDPGLSLTRQVCSFLEEQVLRGGDADTSLSALEAETGYSADHLARTFKRVMGISPFDYYDGLRIRKLKENLKEGETVASAAFGAGFGSSSRLYEKSHDRLGMTPASYAKGGKGAEIAYGIVDCDLGRMLVAGTRSGVCAVYFGDEDDRLKNDLKQEFPAAEIAPDLGQLANWTDAILRYLESKCRMVPDIPLDMYGTAFQKRVWRELLKIRPGETKTYKEVASDMGQEKSSRAVGRACATNPVSLLVPCHRVVGSDGKLHGYRWGLARKEQLRKWEAWAAPETEKAG
ncbi:bifunctional transcriptional activator/DNA repair enzyme AdaA [Sneathiella chinensis]|uniref:Bifunctional transcriptional regulator/O6-methylguanine-DNA methyltransferase n=1 Tax=Sneathiella chinensis TaxID=349750 RepID=A0ABQ5U245_9PROT|nr:methylated-DNA--[protein]-cysteine S-methyltransferase [Sneathiella chinensis]GLQ05735.1 bifunctional transcriptional regulator/O6-methylguanine-DNA methyltransferase [Sneathiella chinensis]